MRKSTMFISAVLTTFMLAIMFGVASAYQKIVQTGGVSTESAQQAQADRCDGCSTSGRTQTPCRNHNSGRSCALASSVIGRTDLYSSEKHPLMEWMRIWSPSLQAILYM